MASIVSLVTRELAKTYFVIVFLDVFIHQHMLVYLMEIDQCNLYIEEKGTS